MEAGLKQIIAIAAEKAVYLTAGIEGMIIIHR